MIKKIRNLKIATNTHSKISDFSLIIQNLLKTILQHTNIELSGCLIIKENNNHDLFFSSKVKLERDYEVQIILRIINMHNRATAKNLKVTPKNVNKKNISKGPFKKLKFDLPLKYTKIYPLLWKGHNLGTFFCIYSAERCPNEKITAGLIKQTRYALINAIVNSDISKENYKNIIKAFTIALDAKDNYTDIHSNNVMKMTVKLAAAIGVDKRDVTTLRDASRLHDLGKVGIPSVILNKKGPLTDDEFNGTMKKHVTIGANILKEVPFFRELYPLVLYHHEKFDGSGYPLGLSGSSIPLGSRIIHIADAFDAMRSTRPYRGKLSKKAALKELCKMKGKQFDPDIVEVFKQLTKDTNWME